MTQNARGGQFQNNVKQYNMDNIVHAPKDYVYRVGYESSSGNPANGKRIAGKTRKFNG